MVMRRKCMNKIKKIIYAAVIFIIVSVMQLNNVNATEMVNSKEVDISVETVGQATGMVL